MAFADSTTTFLEHTVEEGACLVWTAYRAPLGYGSVRFRGRARGAHVVAWTLFVGEIPPGLCVLHTCDNPPCVRLDHLFLGTKAQNTADMVAKGRAPNGERGGSAKLTGGDVVMIRDARARGESVRSIAKRLCVSHQNVWLIATHKRWKHMA